MHKLGLWAFVGFVSAAGCTTVQRERENLQAVLDAALAPGQTCGAWHRKGQNGPVELVYTACTGEACAEVCPVALSGDGS